MSHYHYYQIKGGEEVWKAVKSENVAKLIEEKSPVYTTVLAVSKLVDELSPEAMTKLCYAGPLYFDFDSTDAELVLNKFKDFCARLVDEFLVDMEQCRLYATGGRGFHLEIPMPMFCSKVPRDGIEMLPLIFREIASHLAVDTLDMRIYSVRKGRMWRTPNVERTNGHYKVPITYQELLELTTESVDTITSTPRQVTTKPPLINADLELLFASKQQFVAERLAKRTKVKIDPDAKRKSESASVLLAMSGVGLKEGCSFQALATQFAICAVTAGWTADQLVENCAGLIANHQSDSFRYNTEAKRIAELRRMYDYMHDNACYSFSVGAIKNLLIHTAPDLDGLVIDEAELKAGIDEEAALSDSDEPDEYADVAKGVVVNRWGAYAQLPEGTMRICALSFSDAYALRSMQTGQFTGYDAVLLVNGRAQGRVKLEVDLFKSVNTFNDFARRYGHAFQGTEIQLRSYMMKVVDQIKKAGRERFVTEREGSDLVNIPGHPLPILQDRFAIWADSRSVVLSGQIPENSVDIVFSGFPDTRGSYATDLREAPALAEWINQPGARDDVVSLFDNFFQSQELELLAKLLGWYVACFWKQWFQRYYGKFPLLHVNGSAGAGKTETTVAMARFHYYRAEVKMKSPSSSMFAIMQSMTGSASIPMILDEYKPHELSKQSRDNFRLMFRDAYNQRETARGGGNRDSSDYRALSYTQLSAPVVFISEAPETETAVMERVVLATVVKERPEVVNKRFKHYQEFVKHLDIFSILGHYLASRLITQETEETFRQRFDAIYDKARQTYMLTDEDIDSDAAADTLAEKRDTKERPVFNHAVAEFGLRELESVLKPVVGDRFDSTFSQMQEGIYTRLRDLNAATVPEYVKVLNVMSSMTYSDLPGPMAVLRGEKYEFLAESGEIEIAIKSAYMSYAMYCNSTGVAKYFQEANSFAQHLKDSPAFVRCGLGTKLRRPDIYTFDLTKLAELRVDPFKGNL